MEHLPAVERLLPPSAFGFTDAQDGGEDRAVVEQAIETARVILGMDLAYLADTRQGLQDYTAVSGDAESFAVDGRGAPLPLEEGYCARLLDGELDHLVRDSAADERVRDLPITRAAGIAAYIGVPVSLPDGSTYGTLCCLSHVPQPLLGESDVRLMQVLAALIGAAIGREDAAAERQRLAATGGNIAALVAALEARDGYTEEHSRAVVGLALSVGTELGLQPDELAQVEVVALLHDIGKIGISDAVLRKPGRLDKPEWAEMRRHPEIGERIVASMPGLAGIAPAIRAEHESWNGTGYPDGLRGAAIPLASRVVLVCDAYHAMTSDRPYRRRMSPGDARAELRRNAGSQFCPDVTRAALAVLAPDEFAAELAETFGPDAAMLVGRARANDELAAEFDRRASDHAGRGMEASAAVARRKAAEYRALAREARALASRQRTGLSG